MAQKALDLCTLTYQPQSLLVLHVLSKTCASDQLSITRIIAIGFYLTFIATWLPSVCSEEYERDTRYGHTLCSPGEQRIVELC